MNPFRIKNRRFFATQLLFFVGINVVVLGLVAFVTLSSMVSTVSGIVEHSVHSLIAQTAHQIETEVRRISSDLRGVASIQAIHEFLDAPLFAKSAWEDQVRAEFHNFLAAHDEIELVRFVTDEGTKLSIGRDPSSATVQMEFSAEMKQAIDDPSIALTILDPASIRMTNASGGIISQQYVYFVARVMSRPAAGKDVVGFLVAAVSANHFQASLAALNLAGAQAPANYQTNSFLLNQRLDPITRMGPGADNVAEPRRLLSDPAAYSFEEPSTHWKVVVLVPEDYVMRDVRDVRKLLLSILAFGLLMAGALTYFASRKITEPIGDLVRATEAVSAGNLDLPIHLDSFLEFNTLGHNFNAMIEKLKTTIAERISEGEKKASLEQELKTASLFQKLFLTSRTHAMDGLSLVAHYQPASLMGGDWFSFGVTGDGWLHVHVGDVTGHGTGPALIASFCKGVTDALYKTRQDVESSLSAVPLEAVHQCLNNLLFNKDQSMAFMTLLSLALNLNTGELRYVSSGHPPQYVLDHAGQKTTVLKQELGGTLLGYQEQQRRKLSGKTFLKPGQSIFLYSDGLIDVASQSGQKLNQQRLSDFLLKEPGESAEALKERVRSDLLGAREPVDDVTLIILKLDRLPVGRSIAVDDVDAA